MLLGGFIKHLVNSWDVGAPSYVTRGTVLNPAPPHPPTHRSTCCSARDLSRSCTKLGLHSFRKSFSAFRTSST